MAINDQRTLNSGLLSVREAASFLRLQPSTIRAWVLNRKIRFIKLGGKRIFFQQSDLEALIERSTVPAKVSHRKERAA
jgi:excisionase family DNA binding protein